MEIFEPREFVRKDSSVGLVGSFLLGDATATVKIVLWDESAKLMLSEFFKVGEIVRIIGAYSKLSRDEEIEDWLKDNKYTGEYVVIDDDIFDLDRLPKERLIHVEDGWNTGGIKQEHIDKWEKQRP